MIPPESLPSNDINKFYENIIYDMSQSYYVSSHFHIIHKYDNNDYLGYHSHNFYEINIITQNTGYSYIGSNISKCETGNVYAIPPNIPHGYYSTEDLCIFHILISKAFLHRYANELSGLQGYSYLFEVEPLLHSDSIIQSNFKLTLKQMQWLFPLFHKLRDATCERNKPNMDLLKNSIVLVIISELCSYASVLFNTMERTATGSLTNVYTIAKAMNYIINHFKENISFNKLAELCNMSYTTFYRNFTKISGKSPSCYLRNYRITNAIKLLTYTDKGVTDIAVECGFYDSAHLNKCFMELKHISPSDYRKLVRRGLNNSPL